jgi:hypothetical protein
MHPSGKEVITRLLAPEQPEAPRHVVASGFHPGVESPGPSPTWRGTQRRWPPKNQWPVCMNRVGIGYADP